MEIFEKLGSWYDKVKRDLPWRNSSDPYKIWLSEIILQQTRVAQGTSYYNLFIEKYPDINSLAEAQIQDVLKLWQGLGYYSRALNLHETARNIAFDRNGQFPGSYSELIKLKGIGEYTAAAISSIAYNEPKAAIDGNVKRVISRLFLIENDINSPEGKKIINSIAFGILDHKNPGRHNQALMELGATICLPKKPSCAGCPLNDACLACKENKTADLPRKFTKTTIKNRFFTYLVIRDGDFTWIHQRTEKDIWKGLYQFPLIETPEIIRVNEFPGLIALLLKRDLNSILISSISQAITHKLSHRNIISRFLHISVSGDLNLMSLNCKKVKINEFDDYPIPKLIERYISLAGF